MKILIIGDSHGNITNIKQVLGFGKKINVSGVIHTGDWNNLLSVETIYSYNTPVYGVLGNADINPNIKDKFKEFLEIELDRRKIGIIHKINDIYKIKYNNWDIVFCGHYHSQSESRYKRPNGNLYRVVRPGALENNINFAIYDTNTNKVEFITDSNFI